MNTSILAVLTGVAIPATVVVAIISFALYWIVRKAVRDGINDTRREHKE